MENEGKKFSGEKPLPVHEPVIDLLLHSYMVPISISELFAEVAEGNMKELLAPTRSITEALEVEAPTHLSPTRWL